MAAKEQVCIAVEAPGFSPVKRWLLRMALAAAAGAKARFHGGPFRHG